MSKLIKNIIIYFFGNVLVRLVSFLLLPVYTKYLPPSDFGYFDLVTSIMSVAVPMVFIEIWNGVLRLMFDYSTEKDKRKVFTNGLFFTIGLMVLFTVLYWITDTIIEIKYTIWIFFYGILMLFQNLYQFGVRGLGKNVLFMVSGIAATLATAAFNLVLIIFFNMKIDALLISACAGMLLSIILIEAGTGLLIRMSIKDLDMKIIKEMAVYCAPLMVNSVTFWFLTNFNKILILKKLGLDYNGIFAIAARFTTAIGIFVSVFSMAWQESAFEASQEAERGKYYTSTLNIYIRFLCGGMLVLIPFTYLIFPYFVAHEYAEAKSILPIFYAGTIASAISNFFGHIYGAEKQTNIIFTTTITGSIISVLTAYSLITVIGLQAGTLSILLGFIATIIMRHLLIQKTVKIKIDLKYLVYLCVFFGISYYFFYNTNNIGNIVSMAIMVAFWIFSSRQLFQKLFSLVTARFKS